jgi:hypothetical protein
MTLLALFVDGLDTFDLNESDFCREVFTDIVFVDLLVDPLKLVGALSQVE